MREVPFRIVVALATFALAGCASLDPFPPRGTGRTSLSDPSVSYTVVESGRVDVRWGPPGAASRATIVDNRPQPPLHQEGYNGLMNVGYESPDGGEVRSPFVPLYAGLNLEHVLNGRAHEDRDLQFEPRRRPMELRRIDDATYELYQAPLPETGVESCTRFEFLDPYTIDVTFEFVPRKDDFPYGYLNFFWASYIAQPKDPAIYFYGRPKGDNRQGPIKAESPAHGEQATHRGAGDRREHARDEPFPLTLVFNESPYEYTRSLYWGRYDDSVWCVMFPKDALVRFAQSPSGGGDGNPAWDFHWFADKPEVGKVYRLSYRATFRPWESAEALVKLYEDWRLGRRR